MKSISIEELKTLINTSNINLIDIRDNYIYQLERIGNAINVPSNFLMTMPEKYLDKNKKYYIYCEYGVKSRKLANYLNTLGYDVYNVEGGYKSY